MDTKTLHRKAKLRALVGRQGGPAAFARATGVTRSYVSQLMSDAYPGGEAAFARIADRAGLPVTWFDSDGDGAVDVAITAMRRLPLVSWEGLAQDSMNNSSTEYVAVPGDAEGDIAMRIVGDAMVSSTPGDVSLPPGTIVVIDRSRQAAPGHIVVARLAGAKAATCRQLIEDTGTLYLRATNGRYPLHKVRATELLGVVTSATIPLA